MKTRTIMGVVTVGVISLAGCSTESVTELQTGTCFNVSYDTTELSRVPTVSCAEEHDAEVFDVFEITEIMTYDDEAVYTLAFEKCVEAFEGYVGVDFYDEQVFHLDIYTMFPLKEGWDQGDRGVVCSVVSVDPTDKLTETQRNAFAPN